MIMVLMAIIQTGI